MPHQPNERQSQARITGQAEGELYWITFENEFRMNALDKAMWEALPGIIAKAERDSEVRVVVVRGAGNRAFCAGADISEFGAERTGATVKAYDRLNQTAFEALSRCAKPTIAMISGYCMGGGFELALCCDLRIAAEGAQFAIPAVKLGIGYNPRWFRPLLAVVPTAKLKELVFTGRRLSHAQALALGLVNDVCGGDRLEARTRALAEEIAANAPLSIRAAKRAIDAHFGELGDVLLEDLDKLVDACFESEDYREGQAAFAEKRRPVFRGE